MSRISRISNIHLYTKAVQRPSTSPIQKVKIPGKNYKCSTALNKFGIFFKKIIAEYMEFKRNQALKKEGRRQLLDVGFSEKYANSIVHIGTGVGNKYNPAIITSALKLSKTDLMKYEQDIYDILYFACDDEGFVPEAVDVSLKLAKQFDSPLHEQSLLETCKIDNKYNLQLLEVLPFLAQKVSSPLLVMEILREDPEKIKFLLQDIPKNVDAGDYIYARLLCIRNPEYYQECYDMFNEFYKIRDNWNDDSGYLISDIVSKLVNKTQYAKDVIKSLVSDRDIELNHINEIINQLNIEDKSTVDFIKEIHKMGIKTQIDKVVENLQNLDNLNLFKKFYKDYSKECSPEYISKVAAYSRYYKFSRKHMGDSCLPKFLDLTWNTYISLKDYTDFKTLVEAELPDYFISQILFSDVYRNLDKKIKQKYVQDIIQFNNDNMPLSPIKNTIKYIYSFNSPEAERKKVLSLRDKIFAQREILSYANSELDDNEIYETFFTNTENTMKLYDLLGEEAFFYMFKDKIDCVEEYLELFSCLNDNEEFRELINPKSSIRFKQLEMKINNLKSEFSPDKINIINRLSAEKNKMLKDSLKDPKDIVEAALITAIFIEKNFDISELKDCIKQRTILEKTKYYELLNDKIWEVLSIERPSEHVLKLLNFKMNKFLPQLLRCGDDFVEEFKSLVDDLEKYRSFDNIPQNIETKKQFNKYGIDYNKYTTFDPESYVEIADNNSKFRIQKSDMNNISHSLFLGNHAGCCTKVGGGSNEWSAPTYVKNKLISAIEVFDGKNYCGNTMCYFAQVDNELALILDDIELQKAYRKNNKIRDGIVAYAKKLCSEVGKPDIPIYTILQECGTNLPQEQKIVKIIGSTANDEIYLEYDLSRHFINGKDIFKTDLYKLA